MTLMVCSSLKNGRYAKKKWHLRARLHLFFAAMCRSGTLLVFFLEKTELEVD